MSKRFAVGSNVKWKWGRGFGRGKVDEVFVERAVVTIKGKKIVRNATEEEPAYLVEQANGGRVLKSHSELQRDQEAA